MSTPHVHDLAPWRHSHAFGDATAPRRERALWQVTWLTLAAMAVELAAGWWSGSLALLADGWHMGTHAVALGGAALAAHWSRRAHASARFAFGGWKIEVLSAYTSGLLLLAAGLWIAIDAVTALGQPREVAWGEAMAVAVLGLAVNLASAAILARAGGQGHGHGHGHHHDHDHPHAHEAPAAPAAHRDPNFSAAYLHVLADTLTSVLAIAALAGGLWWGLGWLDPVVALVGALVIGRWAVGVLRHSGRVLLDASAPPSLAAHVRRLVESDGDARVADLHLWQVGPEAYAVALSVVADRPLDSAAYAARLGELPVLRHLTIEVHACTGEAPAPATRTH